MKTDLRSDGKLELLEWLRRKEMKAGKAYTKSKVSAYGPRSQVPQGRQILSCRSVIHVSQTLTMLEPQLLPELI